MGRAECPQLSLIWSGRLSARKQCLPGQSVMAAVAQVEELVPKAELRLREFETAMGLTRVRGAGRGVLSMTARVKEPARPRPVPKRRPAAPKAAAGMPAAKTYESPPDHQRPQKRQGASAWCSKKEEGGTSRPFTGALPALLIRVMQTQAEKQRKPRRSPRLPLQLAPSSAAPPPRRYACTRRAIACRCSLWSM